MGVVAQAVSLPGAAQGASSTAEFYFDDAKGVDAIVSIPVNSVLRAASGVAGVSGSQLASLTSPKQFVVRAGGRVVGSTAGNFTVNLDAGDSTTIASNTTIGTSGAIALDTDDTITTWSITATLMLGPTNSKLQGWYVGHVNNTIGPTVTVAAESVEDLVATGILSFKVSGTFSASDADNKAYCDFLQVLQA